MNVAARLESAAQPMLSSVKSAANPSAARYRGGGAKRWFPMVKGIMAIKDSKICAVDTENVDELELKSNNKS